MSTVRDYVTLQRGITYKGNLVGKPGPALLGLGSIQPGGGFREGDFKTYGGECLPQHMLFPGDMFASLKGATKDGEMIGSVARVPKSVPTGRLTQDTVGLKFFEKDPKIVSFLYWVLRTPQYRAYCAGRATGSAVVAMSRGDFLDFDIPERTAERACVVELFDAIEEKIELNRRRNRTLEAMARAIFQSWFVDFDPVKAKAAGRKPAGLSKEIAVLFPSSFVGSPLGEIPKGWQITTLTEQITVSKGLSYKGAHLCEPGEGIPLHNLNSVYEGGGYKNQGLKWYNGECQPRHLIKPGDVIVTNTEQGFDYLPIGYAAIVPERFGDKGLFSHHIFKLAQKPDSYLPTWFTYLLLRTPVFHELVAGHSNGTTVNMLPLDGLQKPRFVLPPEELVERFGQLFLPAQKQLECSHDENVTLVRDSLLPKLISGELRVPDAERIVGRAV